MANAGGEEALYLFFGRPQRSVSDNPYKDLEFYDEVRDCKINVERFRIYCYKRSLFIHIKTQSFTV